MNTRIYKSHYGWTGQTIVESENKYDWDITTMKRHNGQLVSIAQSGEISKDHQGFSFMPMMDPNIILIRTNGRATEKTIREQHAKAVAIFEEKQKNEELPEKEVDEIY